MKAISRLSRLPAIGMIAGALTLGFTLAPASATSSRHADAAGGVARASSSLPRAGAGIPGARLPLISGTHYVYADDGLSSNNTIDEYKATASGLTHLGTVPTGSFTHGLSFGQNDIAIHGACLVHSDSGGSIQSYSINSSTGLLTQLSAVAVAKSNGGPSDSTISADGSDVYIAAFGESGSGGSLITIPLSSGCALGAAVLYSVPTKNVLLSIALPDATHLLVVSSTNTNDIYTITGGTTLSLEKSNPSSFNFPEGAATGTVAGQTFTFNGQAVPSGVVPQAEADRYTAATGTLTPAPGSPQTDGNPNAFNGPNVYFAQAYNLLTQSNTASNTVSAYSIAGGTFIYKNSAKLDRTSIHPVSQTLLANYLGVLSFTSGTIDACPVAASGFSSCVLEATLTGGGSGSEPGGLGVK